jgi:glutamate dehydrogenase
LEHSDLYDNETSRMAVLKKALPTTIVKQVGLEEVIRRLPEPVRVISFEMPTSRTE